MKVIKGIKKLLPVAILAAVATPVLAEGMSASLTVASNDVWRGVTQTDNEASVEVGVSYLHETGIYAGASVTNVEGVRPELAGGAPSSETDLMVGFTGGMDGFGWDVGYQYYLYTDTPKGHDDINWGEIYASVSYDIVSAGIAWTVNSDNGNDLSKGNGRHDTNDVYYWASIGGPIADSWYLGGTVGYYDFDHDGKTPTLSGTVKVESYTHFQVDLTKEAGAFGDVTVSLSYADNDAQNAADDVITFVSWNKTF